MFYFLQLLYFFWWISINFKYQINTFALIATISQSPISLVIGKLGTGKTLFLTYLTEIMTIWADNIYSNYPIESKTAKIVTFKNFDFNDNTKLIPPKNSFIAFDESFLYIDGTDPKNTKIVHSGKIPWILLARHFGNVAVFSAQRDGMVWNNIRELASCTIVPLSLKTPKNVNSFFPKFFILEIGIFQDMGLYEIWKTKSAERIADGNKSKRKSDIGLGIKFFKLIIPFSIAQKYDSCWLEFVRHFKNDKVLKNPKAQKSDIKWSEISNLTDKQKLDIFDIDILKKNLGGEKND